MARASQLVLELNNFAYSPDVKKLSPKALKHLEHLDVWLVDCIGTKRSHVHAHLEETLAWIKKLKPKKAILTNMGLNGDFETMNKLVPENVIIAYDGMEVA